MSSNFRQSFRITIQTKWHGPTNFRGSRVTAYTCNGHRLTLSWDDALNADENHMAAAKALTANMEWDGEWVGGASADNKGYVFVNLPKNGTRD